MQIITQDARLSQEGLLLFVVLSGREAHLFCTDDVEVDWRGSTMSIGSQRRQEAKAEQQKNATIKSESRSKGAMMRLMEDGRARPR